MARAASRLPAPTASPAGDRVDRHRAAAAAIRNQGSRPRKGRTGDRYRRARLNSHRPLGVQAAIRSDRRPAARHHGPSAPGGSRPAMLMPVHVGPVSRGQRLTSERSHSERGCVLSHIELGDRDRDQGHQAVAQHLPPRRPAVGFRPDFTLHRSWCPGPLGLAAPPRRAPAVVREGGGAPRPRRRSARRVRKCVHAARRWYSWRSPPSRSPRCTLLGWPSPTTLRSAGGSGGSSLSARCGRWVL